MTTKSSNVTSYDVARVAQVSVGTVIRVLNNKSNVDEDIRARVLQVIEELGYVYVPKKRQVIAPSEKIEGALKSAMLCVPPMPGMFALQEIYYYTVLRGAQKVCAENDLHLLYNVVEDSAEGFVQIKSSIERGSVDSLVLVNYGSEELIEGLKELQVPVVIIEPRVPLSSIASIASDDFSGGKLAVEHLVSLGHRAIACIGASVPVYVTQHRIDGYRIALGDAGIPYQPELFVRVQADLTIQEGERAMQQLLTSGVKFSAVFCINDNIAIGAIRALQTAGFRVPTDISIVGFDNHEGATLSVPALTTIDGAPEEKGVVAIQRLLDLVARPTTIVTQSVLPVHLITRASTSAFQA